MASDVAKAIMDLQKQHEGDVEGFLAAMEEGIEAGGQTIVTRRLSGAGSSIFSGSRSSMVERLLAEGRKSVEEANEATMQDRERVLAALAEYYTGISPESYNQILSAEASAYEARNERQMRELVGNMSQSGAAPNPYVMGRYRAMLDSQMSDAMAIREGQLRIDRQSQMQYYVSTLNDIMKATERQTLDPNFLLGVAQLLGQGSSTVSGAGGGGGSSRSGGTIAAQGRNIGLSDRQKALGGHAANDTLAKYRPGSSYMDEIRERNRQVNATRNALNFNVQFA